MNFTREPIIETIITPRDGYRLVVRNGKQNPQEEFSVEAVEVVSFGRAHFYRSLEKPRPFLVPVGDYEVVEVKESRVVLKTAHQTERTIKIGGGRGGLLRKEALLEEEEAVFSPALENEVGADSVPQPINDKKRDRYRRRRHRTTGASGSSPLPEENGEAQSASSTRAGELTKESTVALPFTHLIPPPTTLISETIHRYKEQQESSRLPPSEPSLPKKVEVKESTPQEEVESFTTPPDSPTTFLS